MNSIIYPLFLAIFLSACATTAEFKTSKVTPAANGEVKVKKLKNSNFSVEVNILDLADPERLKPSREHYVVWCKTSNGTFNLGILTKGEGNDWTLSTESTYEPKRIIVSAEQEEKVTKMGRVKVLKSKRL